LGRRPSRCPPPLRLYQNYDKGRSTLIVDGQVSRYSGAVPGIPDSAKQQLLKGFLALNAMAKSVPV
jgi:hypothetical protein